jgi:type VI protein secretion system component VasF
MLSGALGLLIEDGQVHTNSAERALFEELSLLTAKIRIAISIHTDAVSSTQTVRRKLAIRFFRLAGTAPLPLVYEFEFDAI